MVKEEEDTGVAVMEEVATDTAVATGVATGMEATIKGKKDMLSTMTIITFI